VPESDKAAAAQESFGLAAFVVNGPTLTLFGPVDAVSVTLYVSDGSIASRFAEVAFA
jgi:hypothetical protein